MSKENKYEAPKPARDKVYQLAQGENLEIPGLGFTITNARLKNRPEIFVKAIQAHEVRTGQQILGVHVVLA